VIVAVAVDVAVGGTGDGIGETVGNGPVATTGVSLGTCDAHPANTSRPTARSRYGRTMAKRRLLSPLAPAA
jgi:hypothetical protein